LGFDPGLGVGIAMEVDDFHRANFLSEVVGRCQFSDVDFSLDKDFDE
jgi:hypothetical protein